MSCDQSSSREGFINLGYYNEDLGLSTKITAQARKKASENLLKKCKSRLSVDDFHRFLEIVHREDQIQDDHQILLSDFLSNSFAEKSVDRILFVSTIPNIKAYKAFFKKIHMALDEEGSCLFAAAFAKGKGFSGFEHIEEIKKCLIELDFTFEIQPLGASVFEGAKKWNDQVGKHEPINSTIEQLYHAYQDELVDYYSIKLTRVSYQDNPIEMNIQGYKSGQLETYEFIRRMNRINRNLYHFSKRLADTDLKKIEITEKGLLFTTKKDNLKLHFDGRDRRGIPFEFINFGSFEEEEDEMIFELLSDGDVVLDLGANIGWSALQIAKHFPNSQIHSFEPIPETFTYLKRNIKENKFKNIVPHQLGVSDEDGQTTFYYFPEASVIASQKNLIDSIKSKKIACETLTLDTFVKQQEMQKVDFVKCDVEGGELRVLKGADRFLNQYQPFLLLELCHEWTVKYDYHPNDVIRFLKNYGYKCFSVQGRNLKEVKSLDKAREDDASRNFFFLHIKKHAHWIRRLSINPKQYSKLAVPALSSK